jgi:O-succinylbenzoic acid--CoA ligase
LLRATGHAEEQGGFVFLCDPAWSAFQRAEFESLRSKIENRKSEIPQGWLGVPTGGTSGGLRFARHDEHTLNAAVSGFCEHFKLQRVNAVDVLPPHHVSGLMARVRSAATAGSHIAWSWKQLEAGERPALDDASDGWVISLVPTQLQRLLAIPKIVPWLKTFRAIFIGGGPIWPALADAAAAMQLPLSLTYGMTETAAMVTALLPEDFRAGLRSVGTALPRAHIALNPEGVVVASSNSVFRGYLAADARASTVTPLGKADEMRWMRSFVTEDLGRIDERGHLHILGRRDAVIITGGKKVHPTEVEAALRASGEFEDIAVAGVPDAEWGEIVVAFYPGERMPDITHATAKLASHQRPKRFVAVADWPRNAQGKVNRTALLRLAGG